MQQCVRHIRDVLCVRLADIDRGGRGVRRKAVIGVFERHGDIDGLAVARIRVGHRTGNSVIGVFGQRNTAAAAVLERNGADRDRGVVFLVSAVRRRRAGDGQGHGADREIRRCGLVRVHRDAGSISARSCRRGCALCIASSAASGIFNRRRGQSGARPCRRIGKACSGISAAGIGRIDGAQGQCYCVVVLLSSVIQRALTVSV